MVTGERFSSAYYIIVEGEFDNLEPFRVKLIDQLKDWAIALFLTFAKMKLKGLRPKEVAL